MTSEKSGNLIKKYLAGESTLGEEEKLFEEKNQPPGLEEWSRYVKQHRKKAPSNFTDSIWATIETRKNGRQRFLASASGIAASIILFMAIIFNYTGYKEVSTDEKAALLNEALSMFPDQKQTPTNQSILYEDNLIIIYTSSN